MTKEGWDKLSKREAKKWRKRFKTVFLGVLYGLGKSSLAERLDCSVEEADRIIQGLYTAYPKLREYVTHQQGFAISHGGYINTYLGDQLKVAEYGWWQKSNDERERKNLEARMERLSVNLVVQGGTSSIMQSGFFNDIRESVKQGWRTPLTPILTVHDSNTCTFPVEMIFDIRKFYDTYFTEFCAGVGPRVRLLFDLCVGTCYEGAIDMKQLDDDTIEFTGTASSCLDIYDRIMNCDKMRVQCSVKREELVPQWVDDAMLRLINEEGTSMIMDKSSYKIQFHRER